MKALKTDGELLTGAKLANLLGVSPPAVSKAVKNGNKCQGIDLREIAVFDSNGSVKGYRMTDTLKALKRENPDEKDSSGTRSKKQPGPVTRNKQANPNIVIKPGAVRLVDDIKPVADSIVIGTGVAKVPDLLNTVPQLEPGQQKAIMTGLFAVSFGALGYTFAPKGQESLYGILGTILGGGFYWLTEHLESQKGLSGSKEGNGKPREGDLGPTAPVIPLNNHPQQAV